MKYSRFENLFSSKKGDYLVRAVDVPTVSNKEFCKAVGELAQGLSAEQMELALKLALVKLKDYLAMGVNVHLDIAEFRLGVKGVIDPAGGGKALRGEVKAHAPHELALIAAGLTLVETQPGAVGPTLFSMQDLASGTANEGLTPGGMAILFGHHIKIEDGGVKLRNVSTGEVIEVTGSLGENTASKVIFLVPANLPAGTYRLSIETRYSGNTQRPYAAPKTAELDIDLSVPPPPQG
ncbi:MAG: DUF4469 domain-containing protein [Treponematales bacterium]